MTTSNFRTWLKQERIRRRLSQEAVAKKIKTTRVTINRWENGSTSPATCFWGPLSKFLGKPIEELFPEASSEKPSYGSSDVITFPEKTYSAIDSIREDDSQESKQEQIGFELSSVKEQDQLQLKMQRLEIMKKRIELQQKQLLYARNKIEAVLEVLEPQVSPDIRTMVFEAAFSYLESLPFSDEVSIPLPSLDWIKEAFEIAKRNYAQLNLMQERGNTTSNQSLVDATLLSESGLSTLTKNAALLHIQETTQTSSETLNENKHLTHPISGDPPAMIMSQKHIKQPLSNPYQYMNAVHRPEMFFGRSRVLRRLYSAIVSQQCISLVGSGHIGKSSVLRSLKFPEVQQRFEYDLSQHLLISIDLRKYLQKSSDDFFEAVCKQIAHQSHLPLDANGLAGEDEFSEILDQINEQGFHPVLLMDAFDNITSNKSFGRDFFAFLRSQAAKVSYVTASIAPLSKVCSNVIETSPFFNIFVVCHLESLTPEEARELVIQPAERTGLFFSDSDVEWVLAQAGRHPFYLQRICYHLFDEKLHQGSEVNRNLVRDQAYKELYPHFEYTWERLNEEDQRILKDEAQRRGKQSRALPELSESNLFRRFVRDK
ncbi:MAG: helix-turn-helix domain-containing protein, partial [Chloroflexi bacterium]